MGRGGKLVSTVVTALVALSLLPAGAAAAGTATITSGPEEGSTIPGPTATFTYTAAGIAAPMFYCSVDGEKEAACNFDGFTTPDLKDGPHTFAVYGLEAGTLEKTSTAVRHFTVGAPPVAGAQLPVTIDEAGVTSTKRKVTVPVTCPTGSPVACTGQIEMAVTCCDGPQSLAFVAKHIANVKWEPARLEIQAGQTVTYTAKAGKSGKFKKSLFATTASKKEAKKAHKKSKVSVRVTQPGATTLPGTSYSLVAKFTTRLDFGQAKPRRPRDISNS